LSSFAIYPCEHEIAKTLPDGYDPAAASGTEPDPKAPGEPGREPAPVRGRPFGKGQSGNPAGRPPGSRNRAALLAEALLEGEAAALTRSTIDNALNGNALAQRACLERLVPARRERTVEFELPPIEGPADLGGAMGAVMAAVAAGELTPGEAERISSTALAWMRMIEISDLAAQLQELKENQ
jgi:hypothetical protein